MRRLLVTEPPGMNITDEPGGYESVGSCGTLCGERADLAETVPLQDLAAQCLLTLCLSCKCTGTRGQAFTGGRDALPLGWR